MKGNPSQENPTSLAGVTYAQKEKLAWDRLTYLSLYPFSSIFHSEQRRSESERDEKALSLAVDPREWPSGFNLLYSIFLTSALNVCSFRTSKDIS